MTNELLVALISAVVGAIVSGIITFFLNKRKEIREDKKEKEIEKKRIYEERPELQIVEYKNYLDCPGHKLKKKCDINVFITKMNKVSVESDIVTAQYNKDFFNQEEWCCVIYCFKNVGKTDIKSVSPICTYKKNTMLCDVSNVQMILEHGLLSYSTMYDQKVRVGDSFTMRVCYHKNCVSAGMISALMVMGMEDCNNRFWEQPLFAPNNVIYDTHRVTRKEYKDDFLPDAAMECFRNPWLW